MEEPDGREVQGRSAREGASLERSLVDSAEQYVVAWRRRALVQRQTVIVP